MTKEFLSKQIKEQFDEMIRKMLQRFETTKQTYEKLNGRIRKKKFRQTQKTKKQCITKKSFINQIY